MAVEGSRTPFDQIKYVGPAMMIHFLIVSSPQYLSENLSENPSASGLVGGERSLSHHRTHLFADVPRAIARQPRVCHAQKVFDLCLMCSTQEGHVFVNREARQVTCACRV